MVNRAMLTGLLAVIAVLFAGNAMAADPATQYTGLLDLIQSSASGWDAALKGYATKLFWGLAVIYFVWTFIPLTFKQADIGEIVGELIRFILTIGFFWMLLLFAKDWAEAVIDSFRQAGASAAGLGSSGLKPADIFTTAVELAKTIGDTKTWNPAAGIMIGLAAAIVLLCFTFIAAFMGVTLVESYIVINASVLFMGFGGSKWTRDYALAIARYAVSVGAKLFVLTLIVGVINTSAKTWQAAYTSDDASMWTMVGLALVCAYLAKTIPDLIQGIISGASPGGGGGVGGMAAAAVAGATAGAAAATSFAREMAATSAATGGGGGLGSALDASLSAGSQTQNATGSARSMAEGASGAGPSGAQSNEAIAPRMSGAASGAANSSGPDGASGPAPKPSASGSVQEAAKQADAGKKSDGGGNAAAGHAMASGAVRTAGLMAAISVPGMEGAAGLSLGPAPQSPNNGTSDEEGSSLGAENSDNIIRPSDEASPSPAPTSQNSAGPEPIDHATANGAFHETALDDSDVGPEPKGDNK